MKHLMPSPAAKLLASILSVALLMSTCSSLSSAAMRRSALTITRPSAGRSPLQACSSLMMREWVAMAGCCRAGDPTSWSAFASCSKAGSRLSASP